MASKEQHLKWAGLVKKHRKRRGLSTQALAERAGLSQSYIEKIETGVKGNERVIHWILGVLTTNKRSA